MTDVRVWPGRLGWWSTVTHHPVADELWLTIELNPPWWRPTRRAAVRIARRWIAREQRQAIRQKRAVTLPGCGAE